MRLKDLIPTGRLFGAALAAGCLAFAGCSTANVTPPAGASASSITTDSNSGVLEVYVAKDGSINIRGRIITIEKLDDTIKALTTNSKLDTVLVTADKETKLENIAAVTDSARKNGLLKLSISTKKTDS